MKDCVDGGLLRIPDSKGGSIKPARRYSLRLVGRRKVGNALGHKQNVTKEGGEFEVLLRL